MNTVTEKSTDCPYDEINLYDIWKKLVEYKKIFWVSFFTMLILSSIFVLLKPNKYRFSQTIEIGKYVNAQGNVVNDMDTNDATIRLKKILFPKANRQYYSQMKQPVPNKKVKLNVDRGGIGRGNEWSGILILFINAPLSELDKYKFIFKQMIDVLAKRANDFSLRIKELNVLKAELGNRLVRINSMGTVGDGKINSSVVELVEGINNLQFQINRTSPTMAISDFIVSDYPIEPSKLLLFILTVIVSLFFSLFVVFVANFVAGFGK